MFSRYHAPLKDTDRSNRIGDLGSVGSSDARAVAENRTAVLPSHADHLLSSGMTGPTTSINNDSPERDPRHNAATELQGRVNLAQALGTTNIAGASQTFHFDRDVRVAHGTDFTTASGAYVTGPAALNDYRVTRKGATKSPYMQGMVADIRISGKDGTSTGVYEEQPMSAAAVGARRLSKREKMAQINATYKSQSRIGDGKGHKNSIVASAKPPVETASAT